MTERMPGSSVRSTNEKLVMAGSLRRQRRLKMGCLFLAMPVSRAFVPSGSIGRTAPYPPQFFAVEPEETSEASLFSETNSTSTPTTMPWLVEDGSGPAAQFGEVVSLKNRPPSSSSSGDALFAAPSTTTAASSSTSSAVAETFDPAAMKKRNLGVACASVALALGNYVWQYLHPITPIQILYEMEQKSAPVTVIGNTNKPTVVDFWAPWCENCKMLAPTLRQMEEQYGKDINFVMINGDQPAAWPLIEAFGVDAIPHLALVEADGTVDTALIGLVPKQWLDQDFEVLVANAKILQQQQQQSSSNPSDGTPTRSPLPWQMLDVFANRPEQRRIQVQITDPSQVSP